MPGTDEKPQPGDDLAATAVPVLRDAAEDDLGAVQAIYAHHVLTGLASFEETPPERVEILRRYRATRAGGWPYLVAELDGRIAGYAYAGPYRPRPAYRFTVEGSVYVAPGAERRGLGRALLAALIEACTRAGFRRMIAVIGDSEHAASIGLHESLGFARAGHLHAVGFKFGRWVDSVIMERPLGEGDNSPPPPEAP